MEVLSNSSIHNFGIIEIYVGVCCASIQATEKVIWSLGASRFENRNGRPQPAVRYA